MVTGVVDRTATFPRDWNDIDEPSTTFMLDPMHFPFPVNPLSASSLNAAFSYGFTKAAREYNTPILEVKVIGQNHYHFERYTMAQPASDEEARAMGELAEATLKPELGRMLDRWHEEHLPALKAHIHRLRQLDVVGASLVEVPGVIDEAESIHGELWLIHFRIAIPMLLGMQIFDEFYQDVFGADAADAHAMLLGVTSESIKAGFGLYDLALSAKELGLEQTFLTTSVDDLLRALGGSDAGRTFLGGLTEYLDAYGLRQDLFEMATPTWQEDPRFALSSIRNYLESGRDARAEYAVLARSAEEATAKARETLAAYPEAVRGQFEGLLQIARAASFLQEEHNFYIDQQGLSCLRLVYMQIADRLVSEGVLGDRDDVALVTRDELKEIFRGLAAGRLQSHIAGLVEQRRNEVEIARTLTPPPFVGTPPAGPPPGGDPMARALGRFFGGPPQRAEASNQIKGNAGSRGTVSGVARIARTLEEARAVRPGEILVAITTMPAWTPLFGVAAAVVTETGGPLSHCAIVAREYGIPAVVGAHGATRIISTGQRVTVDGERGVVTLEE